MNYSEITNRTVPNFLDINVMSDFIEFMKKFHDERIFLLVSFPRSGNGWIRYLISEALLVSRGIDLTGSRRDTYKHHGITAHCIVTASGQSFGVEDIFPDFYAIDKIEFQKKFEDADDTIIKDAYIKTHHIAFRNDVNVLYLYRNPKDAFRSYFSLLYLKNDKLLFAKKNGEFIDFFNHAIRMFFDVYYMMQRFYVDKVNKGYENIQLVKMEDMITSGSENFDNLLKFFHIDITKEEQIKILERNPKIETMTKTDKNEIDDLWNEKLTIYGEKLRKNFIYS